MTLTKRLKKTLATEMLLRSGSFVGIFFLAASFTFSQITPIEKKLKRSNPFQLNSISKVVKFIHANASTDKEKAYGAYYWIAHNIKYDTKKFLKDKSSFTEPRAVFRWRKAVCEGYANLFREMCLQLGLQCEVVNGFDKGYDYSSSDPLEFASHAWNAVKIDSVWQLVDVTWAAGGLQKKNGRPKYVKNFSDEYFLQQPAFFVLTHLAEVPMWQLLPHPVSTKLFTEGDNKIIPYLKNNSLPVFNFNDSIRAFFMLDSLKRELRYGETALAFDPLNTTPKAYALLPDLDVKLRSELTAMTSNEKIDSLLAVTSNSISLFKKCKNKKGSIKKFVETNLDYGYHTYSDLYLLKKNKIEKEYESKGAATYDQLYCYSEPTLRCLEQSLLASTAIKDKRVMNNDKEELCSKYLEYAELYRSFLKKENDPVKKLLIQKEIDSFAGRAKANLPKKNPCAKELKTPSA